MMEKISAGSVMCDDNTIFERKLTTPLVCKPRASDRIRINQQKFRNNFSVHFLVL